MSVPPEFGLPALGEGLDRLHCVAGSRRTAEGLSLQFQLGLERLVEHGQHQPADFPERFRRPGSKTARDLFRAHRSEEHTSDLQSLMRISYAVFCLNKKTQKIIYKMTHSDHSRHTPDTTN